MPGYVKPDRHRQIHAPIGETRSQGLEISEVAMLRISAGKSTAVGAFSADAGVLQWKPRYTQVAYTRTSEYEGLVLQTSRAFIGRQCKAADVH